MSEAYLPVLEAMRQLCRDDAAGRRCAARPRADVAAADAVAGHRLRSRLVRPRGVRRTRERMLREMGEALDALTAQAPLVLVLEDLHWSDYLDAGPDLVPGPAASGRAPHGGRDLPPGGIDCERPPAEGGEAGAPGQAAMRGAAARIPQRGGGRATPRRSGFPPTGFRRSSPR